MSETKHTPGPWRMVARKDMIWINANAPGLPHAAIAELIPGKDTYGPEDKANARLMATAPELLAVLREYHKANRLHHDEDARLYDLSEAVIAKAEGR